MFKYLKKHQKKALAVLCVVSMIMFIKGLAPSGNANGYTDVTFGDLNGTKVTQSQIGMARDEWTLLSAMHYVNPNSNSKQSLPIPLVYVVLGQGDPWIGQSDPMPREDALLLGKAIATKINENSGTFFLLVREAAQHGCTASDEELSILMNLYDGHIGPHTYVTDIPENVDEERALQAVSDLLSVDKWLTQISNTVKITQPILNLTIAKEFQTVSLNLVSFPASRYLASVAAPTDLQIRNQYDTFKENQPGQIDPAKNPLGFGYQIERRVKLQYIGVSHDEVRNAVIKSKEPADWYVQAFGAFKSNRDFYDNKPLPTTQPADAASTQPIKAGVLPDGAASSTQPAGMQLATTESATTQAAATTQGSATTQTASAAPPAPTTRRVENLEDDFRLHAQIVLDSLYDSEADNLQQSIQKKIQDAMTSGWGNLISAQNVGGAATQTSAITKFKSYDFIKDLGLSIQKEFGVAWVYQGDINQFKTRQELSSLTDIGQAGVQTPQQLVSFADVAMLPGSTLFKPSFPVQDAKHDVFMFRLTEDDPPHTLPFDEVKARVASDWTLSQAYEKALAAARSFLTQAQAQGLQAAATTAAEQVTTTDRFEPAEFINNPTATPSIPPLNLKPDSLRELGQDALNLINTAPPASGRHPLAIAELQLDRLVMVVELNSASLAFPSEIMGYHQAETFAQYRVSTIAKLLPEFVTYDAIAQRMNFKPDPNIRNQ
jgi:hypothetical protein